jgi:3-hydroxybutyrate dehydrogenase
MITAEAQRTRYLRIDLGGHVSVVAGAADAIGRACAQALTAAGSRVALIDLDFADADAVQEAIERAARDLGGIDHLINNAGTQHVSPIAEFAEAEWDGARSGELDGVDHATRCAWPHLTRSGRGRVINIARVDARTPSPYNAAYLVSQHGVVGLTRRRAREGAPYGITVNAVCPGPVAFLDTFPAQRFVDPSEIGGVCAFLCSDWAISVTGAAIPVH